MKRFNLKTGRRGEEIARQYLRKKGYRIIESNFRTRYGEVDIVATDSTNLIFVEVKTKIGEDTGSPEEMVNKRKLSQITQTATAYLLQNKKLSDKYCNYRVDVIAVVLSSGQSVARIDHYENIGFDLI